MRKARVINAIFWAAIAIFLNVGVCNTWEEATLEVNGCPISSLVLGCIVFTAFCTAPWCICHYCLFSKED